MLENFSEIKVESPVDVIIRQVRALITSGQLAPGDKLPAERKMAERLGVSRGHVRDALQKLEFYGILRTLPQSGTVVAGMGIAALEGLITDVLQLEESDFHSLVETRVMLELQDGSTLHRAPIYDLTYIMDRVGSGDGFAADLIYALLEWPDDDEKALAFAVAASAIKHSVYGDANLATVAEVSALMAGDGSGRVSR